MDETKVAAFYNDPVKKACDAWSMAKAYQFRLISIDDALRFRAQRWARFFGWLGRGLLRRLSHSLSGASRFHSASSSSSSLSSSA
jgi:hypothetical protein